MNNWVKCESLSSRRLLNLVVAALATALTVTSAVGGCIPAHAFAGGSAQAITQRRVIEITADEDSRFHLVGQMDPSITVYAGEALRLRITARKTKNHGGAARSFNLFRVKDHTPVSGWDIALHAGSHDYDMTAPSEPGEYEVDCTAACSANRDPMTMHFIVVARD